MKKTNRKSKADKFNEQYERISLVSKQLSEELKKNLKATKKLSTMAHKLYHYGVDNCYIRGEEYGTHQIADIEDLGDKMGKLDWLINADLKVEQLIKDYALN